MLTGSWSWKRLHIATHRSPIGSCRWHAVFLMIAWYGTRFLYQIIILESICAIGWIITSLPAQMTEILFPLAFIFFYSTRNSARTIYSKSNNIHYSSLGHKISIPNSCSFPVPQNYSKTISSRKMPQSQFILNSSKKVPRLNYFNRNSFSMLPKKIEDCLKKLLGYISPPLARLINNRSRHRTKFGQLP